MELTTLAGAGSVSDLHISATVRGSAISVFAVIQREEEIGETARRGRSWSRKTASTSHSFPVHDVNLKVRVQYLEPLNWTQRHLSVPCTLFDALWVSSECCVAIQNDTSYNRFDPFWPDHCSRNNSIGRRLDVVEKETPARKPSL
jgi:hypothetical protein